MSDVSAVTSHFSTANEGFLTTLGSSILAGASTVPLTSTSGLTNGKVFVGIIEPSLSREQTFAGIVDTGGSQLTGVIWTRGTNANHSAGVTIVDYVTGTAHNMMTKGMLVGHNQDGTHQSALPLTSPRITTSIDDANGNEVLKISATASAVNEFTFTNAATGNAPQLSATGGDTNIDAKITPKGTGRVVLAGAGAPAYNAVATDQTTTSTSYTDLSTTGPAVTVTIGTSGLALAVWGAGLYTTAARKSMSIAVSGATTTAASDTYRIIKDDATFTTTQSRSFLFTGLTAGSTTFTAKYNIASGTGNFFDRWLTVIPL